MSFDNFVQTTLGMPLAIGGAVITLIDAVAPNKLPPSTGGVVVLADSLGRPSFVEIISYTARTGLNLTGVVRGLEGTTARAWSVGAYLYQPLTAGGFSTQLATKITSPALAGNAGKVLGVNPTATGVIWVSLPEVPPFNVAPDPGATEVFFASFTGSAFYSSTGKAQASRQVRMSLNPDFAAILWDSGEVVGAGTTVAGVSMDGLVPTSTLVYWQIRYKDAGGQWTAWSTATSFTTPVQYAPTVAGTAFGGGFYGGRLKIGTDSYALIVAPKASGESASLQLKTTQTTTAGTASTWDGGANTAAMIAAGATTHPAANFCGGLTIGGYTDWVLPAKDQLEVIYRRLKPSTTSNIAGQGTNSSSDPVGAAHTTGDPTQTASAAFKTGGAEAFTPAFYWNSTQQAASANFFTSFSNGYQSSGELKDVVHLVRAVRMIKI